MKFLENNYLMFSLLISYILFTVNIIIFFFFLSSFSSGFLSFSFDLSQSLSLCSSQGLSLLELEAAATKGEAW